MAERFGQMFRSLWPVKLLSKNWQRSCSRVNALKALDRRIYSSAARADNKVGAKGVMRCAAGYRVRFGDRGRSRDYGTFQTLEEAKARSRAVQAARISGDVAALDRLRSRPRKAATGAKGVQLYRGRYRVRLRVDGVLRSFGSFETLEAATARANEVMRARAAGEVEKVARSHLVK